MAIDDERRRSRRRQKARPCEPGYLPDFFGGSGEARTHDQWI